MFLKRVSLIYLFTILLVGCDTHTHPTNKVDTVSLGRYYNSKRIPIYNQKYIQIAKYRVVIDIRQDYHDFTEDVLSHNNPGNRYRSMYLKMARDDIRDRNAGEDQYMDIYIKEIGLDPTLEHFYQNERNQTIRLPNNEQENAANNQDSIIQYGEKQHIEEKDSDTQQNISGWYSTPKNDPAVDPTVYNEENTQDN